MKTDDSLVRISRIYPEGPDEKGFFTVCGGIECPRVMHSSEFEDLVRKRKIRKKDYLVEYVEDCGGMNPKEITTISESDVD